MKFALKLAEKALLSGNPPVGAILVFKDDVIGEGIESGKSTKNITNHAEILAVQDAIKKGYENSLSLSTLYTTHEPCIMCSYVIRYHKIGQIVYGMAMDDVGGHTSQFKVLTNESILKWEKSPQIINGVLEKKCQSLSKKFEALLNVKN